MASSGSQSRLRRICFSSAALNLPDMLAPPSSQLSQRLAVVDACI